MTQNSRIGILVRATNSASGVLKDVQQDLRGLDQTAAKLAGGLKGMVAGGVVAAIAAVGAATVGAATELSRMAAQNQVTKASFDVLAAGVGESGDAMLAALQKASRGQIANADLVLASNRAMLLGVGQSSQELGDLLEIARVRGDAMGLSTTQAFNDIVTGLGRMSPLILDNLGITVDLDDALARYAGTIGKAVSALDDQERKQALVNQVIADSQDLLSGATAAGIDFTAPFERMDAAIANAKQSLGELFGPAVAVVAQNIADAASAAAEGLQAVGQNFDGDKLRSDFSALSRMLEEMKAQRDQLERDRTEAPQFFDQEEFVQLSGRIVQVERELDAAGGRLAAWIDANDQSGQALAQHAERLQDLAGALQQAAPETVTRGFFPLADVLRDTLLAATDLGERGMQPLSDHLRDGAVATQELSGTLAASPAVFAVFAAAAQDAGIEVSELIGLMNAATAQLNQLAGARSGIASGLANQLAGLTERGLITRDQANELFNQGLEKLDSDVAALTKQMVDGEISADQFALEMAFMGQSANDGAVAIEEADRAAKSFARTLGSDATKAARDAERQFDQLAGKVQSVLSSALDPGVGIDPDELLEQMGLREDAINENARRLAAIAREGFANQDWLDEFKAEAPDVFKILEEAGDPKATASRMLKDFQDGLVPELIDKDKAKDLVRRMLTGEQNLAQLAQEIATELAQEFGNVAPTDIASLTNRALGVRGGDEATGEDGASVGAEFAAGLTSGIGAAGTTAIQALNSQLRNKDNLALVKGAGEENGRAFGEGFNTWVDNVQQRVIEALADLVAPLVTQRQQQQASLTAAR